jgi:hypothetical protein
MAEWKLFWLNSLTFCTWITSRERWIKIVKEKFEGDIEKPKRYKSNPMSDFPDFGVGAKHTNSPTLGEWAEENKIDLTI